ncbi:MAG TPA: cytochrome c [Bacilli bacterium]|nr:cytochrome c [Bacilli bacterium]
MNRPFFRSRKKRTCLAVSILALTLVGCGAEEKPQHLAFDTNSEGYKLFAESCKGCHGTYLQGRSGPDLTQVGARLSQEQIAERIANGGSGMPAFANRLKPEQQKVLADFLAGLK